jgi:ATP-dependent RNA helicase DDX59
MQIEDQIKPLSLGLPIRTALIVGGLPMPNQVISSSSTLRSLKPTHFDYFCQVYRLKSSIQIVVATPGRLIDILVKHPELDCLGNVNLLVLDEVDMMLQMGFENQVSATLVSPPFIIFNFFNFLIFNFI